MEYIQKLTPIFKDLRGPLLANFGTAAITAHKGGDATNVVTELDTLVEKTMAEKLAKLFPDVEFVGEEFGGNRDAERFWLMDPIDGTGCYLRGLPFATSQMALIEQGEVKFGVVYDFLGDNFYWAERGSGAYKNNEKIHVSNRPLANSYISWEAKLNNPENQIVFEKLRQRSLLIKTFSAGWEMAMIASGALEARLSFDPYGFDYDYAPGSLLVAEAGGIVANVGSSVYDYRNTAHLAANPVIYDELTTGPDAIFPIDK